ncbi:MAG: hypothetical protein ACOYVK_11760 [Bacillota bacterium]
MKKFILILAIVFITLLSGCAKNESVTKLELETKLLEIENVRLKAELTNSKMMINKLENEIFDLKKQMLSSDAETNKFKSLKLMQINKDRAFYTIDESSFNRQSISIIGNNTEGLVESYDKVKLNGLGSGETLEIQVIGSIYNFQLLEVKYDKERNAFVESRVLYNLEEVRNQSVIIETYLPEGMPVEKIKWTDEKGDIHEDLLSFDGYGFDGSIIWSR